MPSRSCNASNGPATAQVTLATLQSALAQGYLHSTAANASVIQVKRHKKITPIALAPYPHALDSGKVEYNGQARWKLGRQGDYLQASWLRLELSEVVSGLTPGAEHGYIRYCHNLAHSLIDCLELSFTGIAGVTFDEFFLDFFSAFTVPASKRNAYDNMIGNLPELVNPVYRRSVGAGLTPMASQVLPAAVLNLPLPMPYTRETGVSLPTGSLIYNDVIVEAHFRDYTDVLVVSNPTNALLGSINANSSRKAVAADITGTPTLSGDLWGTYIVVTSDERKRMDKLPRDAVWENVQTMPDVTVLSSANDIEVPLRYSHAVKAILFALRNKTVDSDRANYTTREPLSRFNVAGAAGLTTLEFPAPNAFDPIEQACLRYEGSVVFDMPVDYFSMVQPFLYARAVPTVTGYHLWSYSLDMGSADSLGSADHGKLTNVNLNLTLSEDCIAALTAAVVTPFVDEYGRHSALPPGYADLRSDIAWIEAGLGGGTLINMVGANGFNLVPQKFEAHNAAIAHTVIRYIGGAAGFPIF
jgi:hypothetical protein